MHQVKEQLAQKKPLFLYVDGGKESERAKALLTGHDIPFHVVDGCLDGGWNYPLVQFYPWEFEGLAQIRHLIERLKYQPPATN